MKKVGFRYQNHLIQCPTKEKKNKLQTSSKPLRNIVETISISSNANFVELFSRLKFITF